MYFKRYEDRYRQDAQVPQLMADDKVRKNLNSDVLHDTYDKFAREKAETSETTKFKSGGHIRFNACPLTYEMREGQITTIYGNKDDPIFQDHICQQSQMTPQMYENHSRLLKPLKRIGEKGSGQFNC